mgnify:CR=1 FL=1
MQAGHTVYEARTGAQAIDLLNRLDPPPDVMFLDIEIPNLPGTRAVDHVHQTPRLSATRIVVITANENYRERIAKSVDAFCVKPVAIAYLLDLVTTLTYPSG